MAKGDKMRGNLPSILEEEASDEKYPEPQPITGPSLPQATRADALEAIADMRANIPPTEQKTANRRRLDPELKAMDSICETLEELDPKAQQRVMDWCFARFGDHPTTPAS